MIFLVANNLRKPVNRIGGALEYSSFLCSVRNDWVLCWGRCLFKFVFQQALSICMLVGGSSLPEFCTFCRIAMKSAPACYVYEDANTMAFLSIRPINEGHTLVVPKIHCENIFEIPDEEASHLAKTVKKVALAVKNAVNAEGIKIVQNNGSAAGQVVFHLHVHVIPEYMGRKTGIPYGTSQTKELEEVARKIRHYISDSRLKPGNC